MKHWSSWVYIGLTVVAIAAILWLHAHPSDSAPPTVTTAPVVTREVTRIVPQTVVVVQQQAPPTPRTVEVRVDQTVVVTRIVLQTVVVNTNTYYTPTPPEGGKG